MIDNDKHCGSVVTDYEVIEHSLGSGHRVSVSDSDLLLKGLSN